MRPAKYLILAVAASTGSNAIPINVARAALEVRQIPNIGETLSALLQILSGPTLDNVKVLIDNGAALLTPQFVNETQSLITTANAALPLLAGLLGGLGGTGKPPAATSS